jgi:quercetin dioxygenase-like cupin family protein
MEDFGVSGVHVIRFRLSEHRSRKGAVAVPMLTEAHRASNISGGITTFSPGAKVQLHSHNTEEMLTVLQGRASIQADGDQFEAEPFDVCYLPAGSFHRVTNIGDSELRLLWIYGSSRPVRILGDEPTRGGSENLNRGIGGIAAWMAHDGASGFTGAIDDQTSRP